MQTKEFHLAEMLAVVLNRIFSRRIGGVQDLLDFMTGIDCLLSSSHIVGAFNACRSYLIEQFPELNIAEMHQSLADLEKSVKAESEKAERDKLVMDWLAKQAARHGETFVVKPLSKQWESQVA